MEMNFKKSTLYPALKWAPFFGLNRILAPFLGAVCFFFGLGLLFPSLLSFLDVGSGLFFILFPLFTLSCLGNSFFKDYVRKKPSEKSPAQAKREPEVVSYLSFKALKMLYQASKRKEPGPNRILAHLLKQKEVKFVLQRLLIPAKEVRRKIKQESPGTKEEKKKATRDILFSAFESARKRKADRVGTSDLLFSLAKRSNAFRQVLTRNNLYPEDVKNLALLFEKAEREKEESRKWWKFKNLLKKGAVGRAFATGYTITLNAFSTDLSR